MENFCLDCCSECMGYVSVKLIKSYDIKAHSLLHRNYTSIKLIEINKMQKESFFYPLISRPIYSSYEGKSSTYWL